MIKELYTNKINDDMTGGDWGVWISEQTKIKSILWKIKRG